MGAYHAAHFFFRFPDVFDAMISLSGLYGPRAFVGNYMDDIIYHYFPLAYLPRLTDPWYLERYRRSNIIVCVGQGDWERCGDYDCIGETAALRNELYAKQVPAWVDFWGYDVNHDWCWWQKQMPYFLNQLFP